jgi:hypothetical protein
MRQSLSQSITISILKYHSQYAKSRVRFLLRLNCTLEDQPQSYIDQSRVFPFRDSRLKTPTHFKTLISLGNSAPRPGAPIGNFMVYVLGHNGSRHKGTMAHGTRHKGTTHYGEQSLKDQENLMVTLMVLIMIDVISITLFGDINSHLMIE